MTVRLDEAHTAGIDQGDRFGLNGKFGLLKFLSVRVFIVSLALVVLSFFVDDRRLEMPLGIGIGSFISLYKMRLHTIFLHDIVQDGNRPVLKSFFLNFFSQSLALGVLVASVLMHTHLFFGVATGLLSTVLVICINGVTEKIGLTHNDWQRSDKKG